MESMDDRIARLLRLKRYEQPPPGYFDNFLDEFRRRRDRSRREPVWSICIGRVRDFVLRHSIRQLAGYSTGIATAAACFAVIVFTVHPPPKAIMRLAFQTPAPAMSRIMEKGLDFERTRLAMQATLLPGSADLLVLPASDEFVPLNLEWDSLDDE